MHYYIDITIFLRHYLRNRENYFESASNYINANILFKVGIYKYYYYYINSRIINIKKHNYIIYNLFLIHTCVQILYTLYVIRFFGFILFYISQRAFFSKIYNFSLSFLFFIITLLLLFHFTYILHYSIILILIKHVFFYTLHILFFKCNIMLKINAINKNSHIIFSIINYISNIRY